MTYECVICGTAVTRLGADKLYAGQFGPLCLSCRCAVMQETRGKGNQSMEELLKELGTTTLQKAAMLHAAINNILKVSTGLDIHADTHVHNVPTELVSQLVQAVYDGAGFRVTVYRNANGSLWYISFVYNYSLCFYVIPLKLIEVLGSEDALSVFLLTYATERKDA